MHLLIHRYVVLLMRDSSLLAECVVVMFVGLRRWSQEFANGGNIVMPFVVTPFRSIPYIDLIVITCDEKDARHVARKHVRKSEMYGLGEHVEDG